VLSEKGNPLSFSKGMQGVALLRGKQGYFEKIIGLFYKRAL